ncbi:hypothetical protein L596_012193 [Steinernema carpocapsae]|uniref:Integrase catalytic domain-containing protein n=1 Tax=Steinernema carpocapsae TaxID=34508 RepID=A0A4U5NWE1_STECR|nr:hypothetical protein L596_012193 [Steinernema carpocapsae]
MLQEVIDQNSEDRNVMHFMANRELRWKKITPYSPWQGGFYERLIRSVKEELYKTIGNKTLSFEQLTTILVEIEGVLNSRPLTYIEEQWETSPILRPIDFIQNSLIVGIPLESNSVMEPDGDYLSPAELKQLKTRNQTWAALKYKTWITGRITALRKSKDGEIREAKVQQANYGPEVTRSVNHLIPLEIPEEPEEPEAQPKTAKNKKNQMFRRTYDLRPRKEAQTRPVDTVNQTIIQNSIIPRKPMAYWNMLCILMVLNMLFKKRFVLQHVYFH